MIPRPAPIGKRGLDALGRRRELPKGAPGRGVVDQRPQPLPASLISLRAHDPPDRGLAVRRRSRLEILPRGGVRAELPLLVGLELRRVALLVGVDRGTVVGAGLEGGEAGGPHPAVRDQLARAPDVHGAPRAPRLPRREANGVALVAEAPPDAVDPAEAERLVDRLGPGHTRPARRLLVEADEELALVRVMRLEPGAELLGSGEEGRLHVAADDRSEAPFRGAEWQRSARTCGRLSRTLSTCRMRSGSPSRGRSTPPLSGSRDRKSTRLNSSHTVISY